MSTMTTIPEALVLEPGPTGAELPPELDTERELLDAVMGKQPADRIAAALYATRTADLPQLVDRLDRPLRIQLRRTRDWRKPEGAVKVDRTTRWGNPLRVEKGTVYGPPSSDVRDTWSRPRRLEEYALYASYGGEDSHGRALGHAVDAFASFMNARRRDEPGRFEEWIAPLHGHDLACWCPLGEPCHADVLLEIANSGDAS
ncbi:hypothetical protein GCM10027059_26160 [Myceligenerans halotolerans]